MARAGWLEGSIERDGADAERLLAEADRLMYQQKRARKNSRTNSQARVWVRDLKTTFVQ